MAYVDDLVEGTFLAMEGEKAVGEVINLGNDQEMTVIDTAYLIHKIANTGKDIRIRYVKMEEVFGNYKDIMRRRPDLTKAKNLLGYEARTNMEEAIKKVIEHRRTEIQKK
jgi:nucleoside-diphosphate-sugar epimerase